MCFALDGKQNRVKVGNNSGRKATALVGGPGNSAVYLHIVYLPPTAKFVTAKNRNTAYVMGQVPNRSNLNTCLRKSLDDVSLTSRRPNMSVVLDDVPPSRELVQISRRLFRHREDPLPKTASPKHAPRNIDEVVTLGHREDPLPNGVHKSVPRNLDDVVTPSRRSDTTEHPRSPPLGMLLRWSSCHIYLVRYALSCMSCPICLVLFIR